MVQDNLDHMSKDGFCDKSLGDKASELASDFKSKLIQEGKTMTSAISKGIEKLENKAADKTDSVLSSIGEGMNTLAGSIRENTPSEGVIHNAGESVAEGLNSTGEYLTHNGIENIGKEITGVIRKYPVTSLWIGVGVGVLLGNAMSRRQ